MPNHSSGRLNKLARNAHCVIRFRHKTRDLKAEENFRHKLGSKLINESLKGRSPSHSPYNFQQPPVRDAEERELMKTVDTRRIRQVRRKTFDLRPRPQGEGARLEVWTALNGRTFEDWLTPRKLRAGFREVLIIASTASSGLTSLVGAHQPGNASAVVAFLLILFFLGGTYVAARLASAGAPAHKRPRSHPLALYLTRALLALFPALSPALGMFALQKAFWSEVQTHSVPAMMLLVRFLMDFLPVMLRYASRRWPKRSRAHAAPCTRSGRRSRTRSRR